eukprot:scaffold4619_cov146-Skeletonema_menzelii.AAC.3
MPAFVHTHTKLTCITSLDTRDTLHPNGLHANSPTNLTRITNTSQLPTKTNGGTIISYYWHEFDWFVDTNGNYDQGGGMGFAYIEELCAEEEEEGGVMEMMLLLKMCMPHT